jgi:hypothetical protein
MKLEFKYKLGDYVRITGSDIVFRISRRSYSECEQSDSAPSWECCWNAYTLEFHRPMLKNQDLVVQEDNLEPINPTQGFVRRENGEFEMMINPDE